MITEQEIINALPPALKSSVTDELVDKLNTINSDPEEAENIRNNFISYTSVLKEGRFKISNYLDAVTYVSYRLLGLDPIECYSRTFPQRYASLKAKGCDASTIGSYAAAYNKNKLVNLILEQSIVPSWVLNQDAYQKAINTQLEVMTKGKYDRDRVAAANSILTHLAKPKEIIGQLNINTEDTSGINEMKEALKSLAEKQRSMIEGGYTAKEIAESKLV